MLSMLKRRLTRGGSQRPPDRTHGSRDPLGPAGEQAAVQHLKKLRYRILGINIRTRVGEADIVAEAPDQRTIVIVEVKSRRLRPTPQPTPSTTPAPARPLRPPPEASVHQAKRRKLIRILRHLARANGWRRRPLRIDIIAIEFHDDGTHTLRHHTGAVTARQ